MKVKIDKRYTPDWMMNQVKADAKEFGARYTVGDLLRAFEEQTKEDIGSSRSDGVLKLEITAMDSGCYYGNVTSFHVEMVVDDFDKIFKISFYVGMDLEIDTRTFYDGMRMWFIKKYVAC